MLPAPPYEPAASPSTQVDLADTCQCKNLSKYRFYPAVQMALDVLQGDVKKMLAGMKMLAIKLDNKNGVHVDNLLPAFPLSCREEFDAFNKDLERLDVRKQLVCIFDAVSCLFLHIANNVVLFL